MKASSAGQDRSRDRECPSAGPAGASAIAGEPARDLQWTQRVSGLCAIPALIAQLGVEPATVLAAAGLAPDALASPDRRIPFVAVSRMLAEATRRTNTPHFGLLAGAQWRIAHLGLLGQLIRQGPRVGDGLRTYVVHQRLFSQGAATYLFEYDASAQFGIVFFHPGVHELAATHDMVVAASVAVIRELCGAGWAPSVVALPRARPVDLRPYRDHFRSKLEFDADRAAITFPLRDLEVALPATNPAVRRALLAEASRLFDPDLLPQLYRSLRLMLLDGQATLPLLAQQFEMHERTLDRRLRMQGTTFKAVLDDVRFEVARSLLRDTHRPVSEIAPCLGYGDDTAFSRAFRRWSGVSPGQWREANAP
jgi:AraC-like DNA-binding protein